MPDQVVFGRDMLFNLTSLIDWRVVTAKKQRKVDIDNVCKNSRRVRHAYKIYNLVYVEKIGIYHKIDYKNQGPYIITELFKNGIVWFQRGAINEWINIRHILQHFESAKPVPQRTQTTQIGGGGCRKKYYPNPGIFNFPFF